MKKITYKGIGPCFDFTIRDPDNMEWPQKLVCNIVGHDWLDYGFFQVGQEGIELLVGDFSQEEGRQPLVFRDEYGRSLKICDRCKFVEVEEGLLT